MNGSSNPLVSIGLPVYNGSEFLRLAAASLLAQSYRNIELIICDNHSGDATDEICRQLAAQDSRVSYERLPKNIGAIPNHNRVLEKARGHYFMWSSHDDIWDGAYVERCVKTIQSTPGAVAAYSATGLIDEKGEWLKEMPNTGDLGVDFAPERFRQLLNLYSMIDPVYGVIDLRELRAVGNMPMHPAADRVVFAGLALRGKIVRLPERLYFRRQHSGRSVTKHPKLRDRYAWVQSTERKKVRPHVEYFWHMCRVIWRSRISLVQKYRCAVFMAKWSLYSWRDLVSDYRS